ncbi:MAG: hypothetical protein P4L99_20105 [Chthoniobacter sp.]|nr:hypothetical protein [Chthoniobacter sp.]
MKTAALLLLLPVTLLAQDAFEQPPTLSAAAILKPEYTTGQGFTVRDAVPTYAGRNAYIIDSDFGVFEADGNTMLLHRVREIAAIAKLREVSRTDEYKTALTAAAASPLLVAKGLVENPVGTVTGIPKGLWKFMNRTGQGLKEKTEGRQRSQYEDSNAAQMIGFAKAKRDVALKLGVDPYSSNVALQKELNSVSWAAYAGKMTFTIATAPVGGGAGMALSATGISSTFENAIRDQSPSDLRLSSLKLLLAMGCNKADADAFLNNVAFSPSVQAALVMHLDSLKGVANRAAFIRLAGSLSDSEGDALFCAQTARLLAELHANGRTLARIETLGNIPVAIGTDGNLIVALEWDYAAWTERAANFVDQLKAVKLGKKAPTGIVIALSGDASPMARQKLHDAGITLATRLAPGPLK